jgi:hypothetical protein
MASASFWSMEARRKTADGGRFVMKRDRKGARGSFLEAERRRGECRWIACCERRNGPRIARAEHPAHDEQQRGHRRDDGARDSLHVTLVRGRRRAEEQEERDEEADRLNAAQNGEQHAPVRNRCAKTPPRPIFTQRLRCGG